MSERPSMWRVTLETQWKWSRGMLLLLAVASFALPLVSLRASLGAWNESTFIASIQAWSVGYAVTAAGLGLVMAILAWSYDHRLRHVYALSLPIPRWRYVILRFSAGLALLTLPVMALFVGTEVVAFSSIVPTTLHAYPVAVTLRFAFASLVAYALFFAISSATAKTAGYILGTIGRRDRCAGGARIRREQGERGRPSRRRRLGDTWTARGVQRAVDVDRCLNPDRSPGDSPATRCWSARSPDVPRAGKRWPSMRAEPIRSRAFGRATTVARHRERLVAAGAPSSDTLRVGNFVIVTDSVHAELARGAPRRCRRRSIRRMGLLRRAFARIPSSCVRVRRRPAKRPLRLSNRAFSIARERFDSAHGTLRRWTGLRVPGVERPRNSSRRICRRRFDSGWISPFPSSRSNRKTSSEITSTWSCLGRRRRTTVLQARFLDASKPSD